MTLRDIENREKDKGGGSSNSAEKDSETGEKENDFRPPYYRKRSREEKGEESGVASKERDSSFNLLRAGEKRKVEGNFERESNCSTRVPKGLKSIENVKKGL